MRLTKDEYQKLKQTYMEILGLIHDILECECAGKHIREPATLDHIIYASTKYSNMLDLGAYFLHEIATKHPYTDGNKRTALLAGIVITISVYDLQPNKVDSYTNPVLKIFNMYRSNDAYMVSFMLATAKGEKSLQEIRKFLDVLVRELK